MGARNLSIAVLLTLGVVGCSQDSGEGTTAEVDPLGPGAVATIGEDRIAESVFRLFTLNAVQTEAENLTAEGRAEIIDRLIYLKLLSMEAESRGLDQERRIAAELELARMQLLARAMGDRFREENEPSEAELRELYERNLERLSAPEYKTRHILVETEEEAAALIAELDQGADFAELAQEHSTGPTGPDGGDLGWITAESVVQPFAEAVQQATPGVHLPTPIETQYGWHVILVEDSEDQVAPGLAAVRQDLIVGVEAEKLDAFLTSLRESAEVTVVE